MSYNQEEFLVKYVYVNGSSESDLGTYNYFMTENKYINSDKNYGKTTLVDLIDVRQISQNGFNWTMNTNEGQRYYMNLNALGALLGAMKEVGYTDINFRGFSQVDGAPGVSTSHKNG